MRTSASSGYSGTPLAKKLGYKASTRVVLIGAPNDYLAMIEPLAADVVFERTATSGTDLAHVFVTERAVLAKQLSGLRRQLKPEAAVWVSWPKKSAKVDTNISEDVIRQVALPLGFVDIKVCAVSQVWSGRKLVVRAKSFGQRMRLNLRSLDTVEFFARNSALNTSAAASSHGENFIGATPGESEARPSMAVVVNGSSAVV